MVGVDRLLHSISTLIILRNIRKIKGHYINLVDNQSGSWMPGARFHQTGQMHYIYWGKCWGASGVWRKSRQPQLSAA